MRRIGKNASITLDQLDAASITVDEATPLVMPQGLRGPYHCGNHIHVNREAWLLDCEKREFSTRGCTCSPIKPPKHQAAESKPGALEQRDESLNQAGLFTATDTAGTAVLLQTLPGDEGRLYELTPALGGSVSVQQVWITTTADTAYVRRWDGQDGANPYIRVPYRDINTDKAVLQRLGYSLSGAAA